jgi:hypothetical protein
MDEDTAQLYGTITAFQFMLENLYASMIVNGGGNLHDARSTRDEMLRQFEDLPPTNAEADPNLFPVIQHGVVRLEKMWAAIETRVAQATAAE